MECQSPWNTPLLPIKKTGGRAYQPVQDLQAANNAIITLHPLVPNPYTLLSFLPPQASWSTCLDLKDAFFLCLAPASQSLFAFKWEEPRTRRKDSEDSDQTATGVPELTHDIWRSPGGRPIHLPNRKSTLHPAPIREQPTLGKLQPREMLGRDKGMTDPTL